MQTWVWVGGLGTTMLVTATVDSWLWWTMYSELGIPIYQELVALVFAKSMRRSIINSNETPEQSNPSIYGISTDQDNKQKNRNYQNIVNLTAVDTKRVADFVAWSHLVPFSVLKLVISCTFLVRLTGWESVLAGLAVAALIAPVSIFLARRYSIMQNRLMKASDKRISTLAEALRNIRQIKFSASEQHWARDINSKRDCELRWLWKASCYNAGLVSMWILGPLLLSVTTFITYALIHGELPASVAFTALSIFASLESSLASLPDALFRGIEAKISADRIDLYMSSSERKPATSAVSAIAFRHATIAWPADKAKQGECDIRQRFVLQNLHVVFPPNRLTVIAGKTASGKSLLLASIIGECDILAGEVQLPQTPLNNISNSQVTLDDWVVDSNFAYVAQDPWIANATFRENILFSLPYEHSRYQRVIHACRFEAELVALPEGDMTYIGVNGVNLSGGQRWRLCFARALYSRAGILVLDDIFSALDAHTRLHLYEHGLTGPLAENRTTILATHHLSLCLPHAAICVILEDGALKFAGSVETLKRTENLARMVSFSCSPDADNTTSQEDKHILGNLPAAPGTPVAAQSSQLSRVDGGSEHKEEKRTRGSTPLSVYTTYLTKGKQLPLWILALLIYIAYTGLIFVRSWWISVWTSSSTSRARIAHHSTLITTSSPNHTADIKVSRDVFFYLAIYIAISLFASIVGTARLFVVTLASLASSRVLFRSLVSAVLRAPLPWSDTVPLGRILNRFTSDLYMVDLRLNYDLANFIAKVLEFLAILAAGVLLSPPLAAVALFLLIVGAIFSTATAGVAVYFPTISAAMAGFGMSFALQYNFALAMALRFYANLEMEAQSGHINIDGLDISKLKLSVLRSRLVILPQEPVLFSGTIRSNLDPFGEHSDVELYRALEQVSLIAPEAAPWAPEHSNLGALSERERVVPSSKSHSSRSDHRRLSATQSSLPLPSSISKAGSIFENPRPLDRFASLSTSVDEGGKSFSHGQRQLVCLARAILSRPKILILDEPTSAVDTGTSAVIQQSLRSAFSRENGDTTLLVIAHRLSSVADFDRIMVMDKGQAVEFGTPKDLLQADGGVFKEMVRQSGEKALVKRAIYGMDVGVSIEQHKSSDT
ncbi:ATP-dependent bile acid permease [Physcia stellaris]|nr:ATP-dependent bile acid permease [Physcia stellaris]